jgi:acyl dehydratase
LGKSTYERENSNSKKSGKEKKIMTHSPSPEFQEIRISIGERIVGQATLTPAEIAAFARMCGDQNPLHHDEAYARTTRFGGIIACGPQLTSLTMGLLATYFTQNSAMLGLEFTFHFLKAVMAGETIEMEWEVVAKESKASLGGEIVSLKGKTTNGRGEPVLTAVGKILVTPNL